MKDFWQQLPKPFFALAPMEDVTDTVFRQIVISCGRPDVFFTEFTNTDGLASRGRDNVIHRFQFTQEELPLIAQIWGNDPENYKKAAYEIAQMGFTGIDINMGCPIKEVVNRGECSGLINNKPLVIKLIKALQSEVGDKLPISVKTRIGLNHIQTEEWIGFLLEQGLDALTIHGRTRKEESKVPNHWDEIGKAVKLKGKLGVKTILLGNGDILSREEGIAKANEYGLDGIMVGRGIFHNPYLFNKDVSYESQTPRQRLELLLKHTSLFEETWGRKKNFAILKKFYKIYVQGFDNASELRVKLMESQNEEEVKKVVANFLNA